MRTLAAHHLLPRKGNDIELGPVEVLGKHRAGGVANRQPCAISRNPVGIGHARARCRAVPCEHHIGISAHRGKVGQFAIGCLQQANIGQFELLLNVIRPASAKTFPGQHIHRARAQQRPQRHFNGACVGGGHDAQPVIGGQAQQRMGFGANISQLRFGRRSAVAAAQKGARGHGIGRPAGAFGTGTRGKFRPRWQDTWCLGRRHHSLVHNQLRRQGEIPEPAATRPIQRPARRLITQVQHGRQAGFVVIRRLGVAQAFHW